MGARYAIFADGRLIRSFRRPAVQPGLCRQVSMAMNSVRAMSQIACQSKNIGFGFVNGGFSSAIRKVSCLVVNSYLGTGM